MSDQIVVRLMPCEKPPAPVGRLDHSVTVTEYPRMVGRYPKTYEKVFNNLRTAEEFAQSHRSRGDRAVVGTTFTHF